jgi:hypothetical protein
MEKLGIAKEDLIKELKEEYRCVKEKLTAHEKLGFVDNTSKSLEKRLDQIAAAINEAEVS